MTNLCNSCIHFHVNQVLPEHLRDKLKKSPEEIRKNLNSRAEVAFGQIVRGEKFVGGYGNLCLLAIVHETLCAIGAITAPITECPHHKPTK